MPNTNPFVTPPPPPPEPATTEEVQSALAIAQHRAFAAHIKLTKDTLRAQFSLLINNTKLTPQQAFDAHGTSGAWIKKMYDAFTECLMKCDPDYQPPAAQLVFTDDGTGHIVVSDPPPQNPNP